MAKQIAHFHPTLPHDVEHYQKCYQTFCRSMHCETPYEPWFRALGASLGEKLDRAGATLGVGEPLRHFGVGSGSGENEKQILLSLLDKFKQVYNCVVDPSRQQLDLYRESLRDDPQFASVVEFDWRQEELMSFLQRPGENGFHVITSIHSIYYSGPIEETVPYQYNMLADGGVMAFVLIEDTDGLSKVQGRFLSPETPAAYRYYTKQKLTSFLRSKNVDYTVIDSPRYNIDVTACFDAHSPEGALLLDFLSHVKHFRTRVPEEQREIFLNLLRENAQCVDGGKLMVTHDNSAVIVQRLDGRKRL